MNELIWIVFSIILFGSSIGIFIHGKRCRQKELTDLLQRLDRAVGGEILDTSLNESMQAAITTRLNRLVQISQLHKQCAEEERDNVKSLISDISHQLRTPLSNIMLYAGLLQELDLNPDTQNLADKILSQSEKLDFFIRELVRSSQTETEMIVVAPASSSVQELIARSCQAVEMVALKKKIQIEQEPTGCVCLFDMKWTVEALGNVLENAMKYSGENSTVTIKVQPYEMFVCISVADQGPGINKEEQGLIFQRFYRSSLVNQMQGFGIGLYLTREILTRQGGYIKVQSEPETGSIFHIYLPRF